MLIARRAALGLIEKRLALCHPLAQTRALRARAQLLEARLDEAVQKSLTARKNRAATCEARLYALGPMQALNRGYMLAMADGRLVTGVDEVAPEMTLIMKDGRARVRALRAERGDPFAGKE